MRPDDWNGFVLSDTLASEILAALDGAERIGCAQMRGAGRRLGTRDRFDFVDADAREAPEAAAGFTPDSGRVPDWMEDGPAVADGKRAFVTAGVGLRRPAQTDTANGPNGRGFPNRVDEAVGQTLPGQAGARALQRDTADARAISRCFERDARRYG